MSGRLAFSLLAFAVSTLASTSDSPISLFGRDSNFSSRGLLPNEEPAVRVLTKRAPCSPGKYYTTRCKTCTAGYSCPDGQNRVTCGAGAYSGPGAKECTLCPNGTFSSSECRPASVTPFPSLKLTGPTDCRTNHKIRDWLPNCRTRPPRQCPNRRHGPDCLRKGIVFEWRDRSVHDVPRRIQMLLVCKRGTNTVRTWDVLQRR